MRSLFLSILCLFPIPVFAAVPSTSTDVGTVAVGGSTSLTNGVYTVRASGANIWGTQDEFRFVYAPWTGDGEITARVDSLTAADEWTKAGVMIRETLAPNSRFALTQLTGSNGAAFKYRQTTGGSAAPPAGYNLITRAPYWVRLRRVGNTFSAYISSNGTSWAQRGASVTIQMSASVYVGLALTSHVDGTLATASFSSVQIEAPQTTTFLSRDIGPVAAAGSTNSANGVYTVRASGTNRWGTQDEFRFVYRTWTGDGEITARVDSLTAADEWTKAGVMIRESLAANSRFAFTQITGGNGAAFKYRQATGGSAGPAAGYNMTTRAPYWVRVRRVGNTFSAYISPDGTSWTQRGSSVTIQMSASVYVGLALTSHVDGTLATASFSNVQIGTATSPPPPSTGSATLTWIRPTTNTDGSPLTDLAGFKVYWGTASGVYQEQRTINNPAATTTVVSNLTSGRWYFAVTALDTSGAESGKSNQASKLIQ
jgi:hypothetical protein